ncbi:MAG: 5-oxoprolinase subunit PxpB [Bacteroidota bacterium]
MHQPNDPRFQIYSLSERAITIAFGTEISESLLIKVTNCQKLLAEQPFHGFITAVPAYGNITVYYEPLITIKSNLRGKSCLEKVSNYITDLLAQPVTENTTPSNTITIPVCYDDECGPDIAEVAKHHNITINDVIRLHSSAIYKVYMIGFLPGFAYMGGLNIKLATPRKATPRKIVPAGSVGIAGQQTGVYPLDSPGGWQLIGKTPISLFNINNTTPSFLKAGDDVIFKPITANEFKTWAG